MYTKKPSSIKLTIRRPL